MAYIDQRTGGNQRVAAMTVVAVIQGAAVIALINGLAVTWLKTEPIPNPRATDIPVTMPLDSLPPPKPKVDRPDTQIDTVQPKFDMPTARDPVIIDFPVKQPHLPPIDEFIIRPDPLPTPSDTFTPRAAKPRNAPGGWATTNDYPARDLREGNQGVTGFLLTIGADGKVLSCQITRTSGHSGLDKATCDNVTRRARFEPATDSEGLRVQGTYSNAITWRIPQD